MKILAFILSIYIFALNLVPCESHDSIESEANTEVSQAMDNEHHNHTSDLCSPFCICQCCHVNAIYTEFASLEFNNISIFTQDFFYLTVLEKDFTTSLLQPPRA